MNYGVKPRRLRPTTTSVSPGDCYGARLMKRARLLTVASIATTLIAVSPAAASLTLTKARAHRVAKSAARYVYLHTDDTTSYSVEAAEDCARRNPRVVDCQAQVSTGDDVEGISCDFLVRVTLAKAGGTSWRLVGDTDCG